ncbi:MAG: hypothetical protein ACLQLH_14660 [Terracidiphilus sp.]
MKHWTLAVLLVCMLIPSVSFAKKNKNPVADLSDKSRIFIGWINLDPESYFDLGYSREEWEDVIRHENVRFQGNIESQCSRTQKSVDGTNQSSAATSQRVTGAKDSKDENTAGNDFYVKFEDASFSTGYVLSLSVHVIDLKTNTEIASIPAHSYGGHLCGLTGCMEQELDQVNRKLDKQISCTYIQKSTR